MALLVFLFAGFIILYNLIINLTNLSNIVEYCFETGSLDDYWDLFYKACISRRAIYSSIIAAVIGFLTFIIIAPFVIIKGIVLGKKVAYDISSGAIFKYENYNLLNTKFAYTNIAQLGIDRFESTATGNLAVDLPLIMAYIEQACDTNGIKIKQQLMQYYDLVNEMQVQVPLIIETGEKVFPVYLIYTEQHKESFQKIGPLLKENHFENAIYFSILDINA
ncbi:hypothetical protein GCM10022289_16840 [Pedobacter jeongneungensis]|uniref:Uncharacterized protein n=1 Tax=Pedobacter jeongneungensis TaxID=947309 RepID=A0ABP8BBD6_9SPHI